DPPRLDVVGIPQAFTAEDTAKRPPDDAPHHQPTRIIQPDHAVSVGPYDAACPGIVAVHYPALAAGRLRERREQSSILTRLPVVLPVNGVKLDIRTAELLGKLPWKRGLSAAAGPHN